jgi:hypothetical protein
VLVDKDQQEEAHRMATKDGSPPDDLFRSEHAEPKRPGIGNAWHRVVISSRIFKTSILVATVTVIAILTVGNPIALFANVTASLVETWVFQPGSGQSTAGAQALAPTVREAPTRDEFAAALEPADLSQAEISKPPAEALVKQFQAWAAGEDVRTQVGPAQSVQDAPAQVVQNVSERVRPMQKHRQVRPVQNAQAEIRPVQNPRAKVGREQNARVQVRPTSDARAR